MKEGPYLRRIREEREQWFSKYKEDRKLRAKRRWIGFVSIYLLPLSPSLYAGLDVLGLSFVGVLATLPIFFMVTSWGWRSLFPSRQKEWERVQIAPGTQVKPPDYFLQCIILIWIIAITVAERIFIYRSLFYIFFDLFTLFNIKLFISVKHLPGCIHTPKN